MDLPTILLISAAISIGATVIAILVALRSAREARSAIFPIVREEESTRARRARVSILVWIAITALLLGGWLASLRLTAVDDTALISDSETVQPAETGVVEFVTPPPSETLPTDTAASPTTSALVSEPPAATPTKAVLASPTPAPAISNPTPTETSTPVPTATSTPVPLGPAPTEAQMGPLEFATEIASPIKAVNPGNVFSPGVKIYAVYPYRGMENGTFFIAVWYQNGVEIARDERDWQWGWQGYSYSFLLPPGAGEYKLELYVNDSLLTEGLFEIR